MKLYRRKHEKKFIEGIEFEKYVMKLFSEKDWAITDYTKDVSKGMPRYAESSMNPDMVVRHRSSGLQFAIESKYRNDFIKGQKGEFIKWSTEDQIKRYKKFFDRFGHSMYIVIGIGGKPNKPQKMYLIPFNRLRYVYASKEYLEKFKRDPIKEFSISKSGELV